MACSSLSKTSHFWPVLHLPSVIGGWRERVRDGVVMLHADPFWLSVILEPSVYRRVVSGPSSFSIVLCCSFLFSDVSSLSGLRIGKVMLWLGRWVFSRVSPGVRIGCRREMGKNTEGY